jgi:fibronectin type III domain protein/putative zinc finger protein
MLNRILPRTHRFHCPDEHQLAAYVDQQLIGAERERVESHLAKCDSCLRQVGFLIKESQVAAGSAPPSLVDRAKKLDTEVHTNSPLGWKWITVAAGIAVIAIGLVIWREARPNTEENATIVATAQQTPAAVLPDKARSEADMAVRSVSPPGSLPQVLSPQPGVIVHASDFIIHWEAIPNVTAYEVRVVTAEGDLVWSTRVHENSANAPKQMLRPGLKYFLWVRAFLANGKTEQSEAVGFIGG